MTEKKDLSRQTLVVLVFLAILVTLLGTLTVMSEVGKVGPGKLPVDTSGDSSQGTVKLVIAGGEPMTDTATGRVVLEIV